jgi:hypothetical protein
MSHFTTIKTQIKDIDALRSACQELGLPLLQNADARGYVSNTISSVSLNQPTRQNRTLPARKEIQWPIISPISV